jgi:hypothetical protein
MNTKVLLTILTFLILTSFVYPQVYVDNTTLFILNSTNVSVVFDQPTTLSQIIISNDSITLDEYTLLFIPSSTSRTNITITNFALSDFQFKSTTQTTYNISILITPVPYTYPLPARGATRVTNAYYRGSIIENDTDGRFTISSNSSNDNIVRLLTTESGGYSKCMMTSDSMETMISFLPLLIAVLALGAIVIMLRNGADGKGIEFNGEKFRDSIIIIILVSLLIGIGMIIMTSLC